MPPTEALSGSSLPPATARRGLLVPSWSMAGGLAGGLLVVVLLLLGSMHPDGMLLIMLMLVAVGSALGTVHGAILRRLSSSGSDGRTRLAVITAGAAGAVLGFVLALLLSSWLTLSAALVGAGRGLGWAGLILGLPVTGGLYLWAAVVGWDALRAAYGRWPEHRLGTVLLVGALVVVTGTLFALRPTLQGMDLRLSPLVIVILAALATLWVAAPAIVVALHYGHRRS